MAQRPDTQLDLDRLIAVAFAHLEEEGLDALSMRRLAARIGVQAPALYWHVSDKGQLLSLMAGNIYAAAHAGVAPAENWRDWLVAFGWSLRATFLAHRDGARLCALAPAPSGSDREDYARKVANPLVVLGLPEDKALAFQASMISFTLGWAMFETNGPMREYLQTLFNFDESFETGLNALVIGLPPA